MPKPTKTATALKHKASNTIMPKKKQKKLTRDTTCTSSTESLSSHTENTHDPNGGSQAMVINLDSDEAVETEEVAEIEDAEEDPEVELGRVTAVTC